MMIKKKLTKLIPVLSEKEKQEVVLYFSVYEKYHEEISERAKEELKDHPVFGDIISRIPVEIVEKNSQISLELQKDAITKNNWLPFIEHQTEQGINYAKMGLDFKSWYEVVSLVRNYLFPYLQAELGNSAEFLSALNGMNSFMDIAMSIIGDAYLQERNTHITQVNQRLSSVFETTADAIYVLEVEGKERYRFSTANKSFEAITGISANSVTGKTVNEIIPSQSLHQALKKFEQAIERKMNIRWEETSEFPNGLLTVVTSIAPLFNEEGKCIRLVGVIHDITERKKAEIKIKKLNEELEQKVIERTAKLEAVNKELEAFSYSVSHDLRAPLRAINGYAEMLSEDYSAKLDEEGIRILGNIGSNATKMGTLIDELLAFSRLGRTKIQKKKIDLNELTEGVLNDLNKSVPHKATINVRSLHPVNADYRLLHQVMFNLLSNAVKYSSKKDNPVVEINSEKKSNEIIISVKDNGAGFDMQYVDKLFGVFQRLHSQEEFEGTGVGLAIVQRLIAKHGGRVWAEGKENEGANFYFSLKNN